MLTIRFPVVLLLLTIVMSWQVAQAQSRRAAASTEKSYLRIESSALYDSEEQPEVTNFGVLGLDKDMVGHMELTLIDSVEEGKGLTLDAGGGYGFNWYVSMYVGLGLAVGYNMDNDEFITTYYPEAGIVVDITKSFGLTLSKKRYFHLYDDHEDVIMLGLVFR